MKIVIDMLGAQTQSHRRGIGRNTRDVVRAFLDVARDDHEVHLALSSPLEEATDALLSEFRERMPRERIHYLRLPFRTAAWTSRNDWRRAAASRLMRHQLDALQADWVWHTSVFEGHGEDAPVPDASLSSARTAAILYDLIPLHTPDILLPDARSRRWYEERLALMRRADLLTSISDYSRDDAIERIGLRPEQVVTIGSVVDPMFAPLPADAPSVVRVRERFGLHSRFVLYSGGFDARKNIGTLIKAYAALSPAIRSQCPLVLAGHIQEAPRHDIEAQARRAGLRSDEIRITGSLTDEELIALYASCALFVFPSRLEGFGLPPAEAMACGAPTLASRATSLPEVVGRDDMLFDPDNPAELADRMQRVLTDEHYAESLRAYGPGRVRRFLPQSVAQRALDAFERQGPRSASVAMSRPAPLMRAADPVLFSTQARFPQWAGAMEPAGARHVEPSKRARDARSSPIDTSGSPAFHVLDSSSEDHALALAREEPGVILLGTDVPSATRDRIRVGTYLGSGYAALAEADRADAHDPMAALVPVLQDCVGVVTENAALADRVRSLLRASNAPDVQVASADAVPGVDTWFSTSCAGREGDLVPALSRLPGDANDDDLAQIAYGASASRTKAIRCWFVDVTRIATQDLGTGVHRVVRSVLASWLRSPPPGIRVEPVRFEDGDYRFARRYATALLQVDDLPLAEGIVQPRHGDMFVGLDWAPEALSAAAARIADWRRGGVETAFIVHDLLPVRLPAFFHAYSRDLNDRWLRDMSRLADRVVCVSNATAQDYRAWLKDAAPAFQFLRPPGVDTFRLGVDPGVIAGDTADLRDTLRAAIVQRPTLLMVGTLEPRKGHRDALDAAERLWRDGVEFNLVIAGRRGWMVDDVIARLERHPRKGTMLHWHDDVSDRELGALYRHATALLAASLGEGYGLPLIEAAQHGLPVIARDIAVFREVMGGRAVYLPHDAARWDEPLRSRLAMPRTAMGEHRWPTWADSATELARAVAGSPVDG